MKRALFVLASCLLAGCMSRTASPAAPAADLQSLDYEGRTRTFLLRLPPQAGAGDRLPLVLVLHGGAGNAANAERMTGFTALGMSEGFIVAYPQGTARGRLLMLTWNSGHCCGYAMESRVDDVGFLRHLIAEISRRHPVDRDRVFVTGMSNGAMMSHRVGIELGETIAAIAPVVGGLFGDEPKPRAPVSALMINGMLDRSVPYEGGSAGGRFAASWDGVPVEKAIEQAEFWAASNSCTNPVSTESAAYIHVSYTCPNGAGVEFYGMKNDGHAWPGGERGSRSGDAPTRDLQATRVIWDFFAAHPKKH